MSVQTIFQSACFKFGVAPDHVRFGDDFYSAINDSQNEIAVTRNWGFLRTTTTLTATIGSRTIALPANFCNPYRIRGGVVITTSGYSGDVIELMTSEEWYNNFYEDGSTTGEPTYAYIMGTSLYLSPIPDAGYTIHFPYYKLLATIEDTSSSITIPVKYQELLRTMIYRRLQDAGYSAVQEIQISDMDIARLMNRAARDDIESYGGFAMNLPSSTYKRRTV